MAEKDVRVRDWQHFVKIVEGLTQGRPSRGRYIFRGEASSKWTLEPSLARILREQKLNEAAAREVEREAERGFNEQAHLHVPPFMLFEPEDVASRWAVMQHYGAPSRLLDWTMSAFVAAYFAVEKRPTEDGVVHMLDRDALQAIMGRRFPDKTPLPTDPQRQSEILLRKSDEEILYAANIRLHTDRMAAQQTLFTLSPRVLLDHGRVISAVLGKRTKEWQRVVIPAGRKSQFMRRLRAMNITARSLFPGIDGLGRSVSEMVRLEALYRHEWESERRRQR